MKVKDLLKHTQSFIFVRLEECHKFVAEDKPRYLLENLPADRLAQTVGLINGADSNFIKISIIPKNK